VRGHGLSEGERGHAVSNARQIVADVSQFLAWLKAERPNDPIILVGHSAGGGVILGVSRTSASELVSGYIFLAPYLGLGSATVRPRFGGWVTVRSWRFRAIVLLNLFGIKRFNDNTVVEFNMDACLYDPRFVRSWSFNTALAFGPGPWVASAAIAAEKPVLVLAGEADQCFVTQLYRYAFKVIAPHAVIHNVGPAGHWDLLVDPGTIAAVENWIDEKFADSSKGSRVREIRNDAVA
jgi:alpha-beta hydrolase superfamily lysophospholipase